MNRYFESVEMQHKAIKGVLAALNTPHIRDGASEHERVMWKDDLMVMSRATPFYWSSKCVEMVQTLMLDFNLNEIICSRELLPVQVAWHYFEKPLFHITVNELPHKEFSAPVVAVSWAWGINPDGEEMLSSTAWVNDPKWRLLVPWNVLWASNGKGESMGTRHDLQSSPEDKVTAFKEIDLLTKFTCCASTFLRQKLLKTSTQTLERHARKRLEKETKSTVISPVTVVYMRSLEENSRGVAAGSNATQDTTQDIREYDFQWTVRGHVRQQYYASQGVHLPIYIHPYLKGPEDKPLKPRSTSIIAVSR